jgi:hypothetical protein
LVISICSCYEYLAPCGPGARSANIPKPLVRMQICRSRLAGEGGEPGDGCVAARPVCRCRSALARERGEPGDGCVAARSPSRASALLQVIWAAPVTFGVRKIRQCGRYRRPSTYAISVNAGDTGDLSCTQHPSMRATPPSSAYAKSVGAGLLAKAVSQATDALRQDRLRGQARCYKKSRL